MTLEKHYSMITCMYASIEVYGCTYTILSYFTWFHMSFKYLAFLGYASPLGLITYNNVNEIPFV